MCGSPLRGCRREASHQQRRPGAVQHLTVCAWAFVKGGSSGWNSDHSTHCAPGMQNQTSQASGAWLHTESVAGLSL